MGDEELTAICGHISGIYSVSRAKNFSSGRAGAQPSEKIRRLKSALSFFVINYGLKSILGASVHECKRAIS
ncbi:hypothetical protein M2350_001000 [Candidatus Fervidibacter sacchari]|jgi:hypothetical protein|uniref:Uncharacterized protein n=1 Tax=Candidatus Fervidibacter sacchari TaxID=1448929 RepID=A0ABT2EL84_9BACT|nr:hypothetical protein [Candidatus Fervidibacter sacchari]